MFWLGLNEGTQLRTYLLKAQVHLNVRQFPVEVLVFASFVITGHFKVVLVNNYHPLQKLLWFENITNITTFKLVIYFVIFTEKNLNVIEDEFREPYGIIHSKYEVMKCTRF